MISLITKPVELASRGSKNVCPYCDGSRQVVAKDAAGVERKVACPRCSGGDNRKLITKG